MISKFELPLLGEKARKWQAEHRDCGDDDERSGGDLERSSVNEQDVAEPCRANSERNEHRGEASDETGGRLV